MSKDDPLLLERHEAFAQLGKGVLDFLRQRGEIQAHAEAEVICREGLGADYLFFLLNGEVRLLHGGRRVVDLSGPQGHFGWNRYEEKYFATAVVQSEEAVVFRIHREILKSLFAEQKSLSERFYLYCLPLGAHLFFKAFNLQDFILEPKELYSSFKFEFFDSGQTVIRKGGRADKFYIIADGQARLTRNYPGEPEKFLKFLRKGDYFGEIALFEQRVREANIVAGHDLALFSLPYDALDLFLSDKRSGFVRKYLRDGIKKYTIDINEVIIGSDPECNIHIKSNRVAPRHVRLTKTERKDGSVDYTVKPLINTTIFPVFVNRQLIDKETPLSENDELFICNFKIIIDLTGDAIRVQEVDYYSLLVENISFKIKDKTIVDNVSFAAESQELVCIMGSSGSGKSSLLDLISGARKQNSGNIQYNHNPLYENLDFFRDLFGVIPQDDILYSELTVYENLYFAAKLREPFLDRQVLNDRIDGVLTRLNLLDKKHERVGSVEKKGLSGGERKRVNIARELVFGPHILFVDEPTSGLSSKDSEEIIVLLREIANSGKLVFVVVHQPGPKIFKMFDRIILLDKGGKLVYTGPVIDCLDYMAEAAGDKLPAECPECGICQPELIFETLEKKDEQGARKFSPDDWQKRFVHRYGRGASGQPADCPTVAKKTGRQRRVEWAEDFRQFFLLICRTLLVKLKDVNNLLVSFGAPTAIALLTGFILSFSPEKEAYVFFHNKLIPTYFFIGVIFAVFIGLTNSVRDIVGEQAIFNMESRIRLRIRWYVAAKFVVLIFIAAVQVALFILICNVMLDISRMFWLIFSFLYLASVFGVGLGLFLSSFAKTSDSVVNWIPLVLIPQIILGGALVEFDDINRSRYVSGDSMIPAFCQVIPSRWAHEAVMVALATLNPRDVAVRRSNKAIREIKARIKEIKAGSGPEHDALLAGLLDEKRLLRKEKNGIDQQYPFLSFLNERVEEAAMNADGNYVARKEKFMAVGSGKKFFFVTMYEVADRSGFEILAPYYAENKAIVLGSRLFEMKTVFFNSLVLLAMTFFPLGCCVLTLRIKRRKNIYVR